MTKNKSNNITMKIRTLFTLLIVTASTLCVTTSCTSNNAKQDVPNKNDSISTKGKNVETKNGGSRDFSVNIFIENSGSMQGYFKGQDFQMEIGSLITGLQQSKSVKDLHFYYINKSIHKGSDKSDDFIRYLASNANVGNTASTNIGELIEKVSDSTYVNDNSVSILISDFIISPGSKNAASVSASEINKISGVSNKLADKKYAVAFYRMLVSDFTGKYYDCDDKPKLLNNAKRPYFVMVVGLPDFLSSFNLNVLPKISKLDNKTNDSSCSDSHIFFKLEDKSTKFNYKIVSTSNGKFKKFNGGKQRSVIDAKLKNRNNKDKQKCLQLKIKVDLSYLSGLVSDDYCTSIDNYELSNRNYMLQSVKKDIDGWYVFTVETTKKVESTVLSLKMKNSKPNWFGEYSINDCSKIFNIENIEKTYGLEYIMRGIFQAFSDDEYIIPEFAKIGINNNK